MPLTLTCNSCGKVLSAETEDDLVDLFLYTAAPLKVVEASGSPVNPVVVC